MVLLYHQGSRLFWTHRFFSKMININSSKQRNFMNLIGEKIRTDINDEIRLLLTIANELYRKDRVSSYRNFCKKYLQKNSNLLNVLIYNDKKPSIPVLLSLYLKLNQEKLLPYWQQKLSLCLLNKAMKGQKWPYTKEITN